MPSDSAPTPDLRPHTTTHDLLTARYGEDHGLTIATTPTIDKQLAHRSVRLFTGEPIGDAEVNAIIAAASSASSSSNQLWWSVVVVRDPQHKEELRRLSGGQAFITTASAFLVWVADLSRAVTIADAHHAPTGGIPHLESTITAIVDTALAAQNAAVAAESLGLGITFVGGVRNHPLEVAELLGLPKHAFAVFGLAVGHPDPSEDADIRPRLRQEVVVHHERYEPSRVDELARFDDELRAYFSRFGADRGWFESVLKRIESPHSLHGRHRIHEHLAELGVSVGPGVHPPTE